MDFFLYDSVKKQKVPLEPIKANEVSIYVCGPTVYDDAHLGHARSALSFDLLKRALQALGYKVTLAKNFTDIDDKIINKMKQSGKSLQEITNYYINRYLEDMQSLGVQRADIEPKATQSLDAIEDLVKKLLENGCAYKTKSGDIYFDVSKDKKYGSISLMKQEEEQTQSRIQTNQEKKNPQDFALWKVCDDKRYCFQSDLTMGRPGWHIECSAMIAKHFKGNDKYCIDIHAGGVDLLFPHHENEAAQTRCALKKEIAKYWMHNGFVQIDGEKMSKSLGNSFFLKDALKVYDGELLRYYLISVHYRNNFNFNEEDLLSAKKRLDKLYRLKKRLLNIKASQVNLEFKNAILEALCDDLNTSKALAIVDEFIAKANETLDKEPKNKSFKQEVIANIAFLNEVLGIGTKDANRWFQQGVSQEEKEKIEHLIQKRAKAKKAKEYALADKIRDELNKMGITIMDTPNGTIWEKI